MKKRKKQAKEEKMANLHLPFFFSSSSSRERAKVEEFVVLFEEISCRNEVFTLTKHALCYWYTVKLLLFMDEIPKRTGFSSVFLEPMQWCTYRISLPLEI
ncbi:hypothetical protein LOAG_10279 [Loa loa]|uniref:Uncharacterized protein n=1 Tax=Loa loa TaxID=7209 RepID=A0A1S0TQ38_LOALO|nr:hypothetical protein LOAG_10279 [Loa loa]EFO18215.1 hypothetical protein LOAG_10279 [Loa loa]